jgi:hypothetical protein
MVADPIRNDVFEVNPLSGRNRRRQAQLDPPDNQGCHLIRFVSIDAFHLGWLIRVDGHIDFRFLRWYLAKQFGRRLILVENMHDEQTSIRMKVMFQVSNWSVHHD